MRRALVISALVLGLATAASGVIIDSGDGTGNTSAPTSPFTDPGWNSVGILNGLSCVYLGGKFVLTAGHVGTGNVVFNGVNGVTYRYVPGTAQQLSNGDGTTADLLMFEIYPEPPLPALSIPSATPLANTSVIMIGNGANRGPATTWNFIGGYDWGTGQSMRWGTNAISGSTTVQLAGASTMAIETTFVQGGSANEAQAAVGDSGGAAFAQNGSQWDLAGILFAIGFYPNQPPQTALYGNITYGADLSSYRSQILNVMAMPEPRTGVWPGAAFVALLARRRTTGSTIRRH
jgi:hypothetical protein